MRQISEKSCGYTAVKVLLVSSGCGKGYLWAYEPESESTSPRLTDLVKYAANTANAKLSCYKILGAQKEALSTFRSPIALVTRKRGATHMVILLRLLPLGWAKIYDPASGTRVLPLGKLAKMWTGVYLKADVSATPYKEERALPVNNLERPYLLLISTLPGSALAIAIFFPLGSLPFVVFMGVSLLALLTTHIYMGALFSKMDQRATPILLGSVDKKARYEAYQEYKGGCISFILFVASLLVGLLAIGLLAYLAEPSLLIWGGGLLLGEVLLSLLYHKSLEPRYAAGFETKEAIYYQRGKQEDLFALFKGQRQFAKAFNFLNLLRMALFLLIVGLYVIASGLDFSLALVRGLLLFPLKDMGESLVTIWGMRNAYLRALTRFMNEEESDSFHNKERSP